MKVQVNVRLRFSTHNLLTMTQWLIGCLINSIGLKYCASRCSIVVFFDMIRSWSKSRGGGGCWAGGKWGVVSKFRALEKGGSPQFSASGRVGHESF